MNVRIALIGALLAATAVGCGDDGPVAAPTTAITITAEDFKFGPAKWSVYAGEFELTFHNHGSVEHEWAILKKGEHITEESEFEEDLVLTELDKVPAGEMSTASFTIEEPGEYQVICALDGHFDAGMSGILTVFD